MRKLYRNHRASARKKSLVVLGNGMDSISRFTNHESQITNHGVVMLAGVEHGISKSNVVIGAARDLDFSLKIKRERMRAGPGKGYDVFGVLETIYFEPDKDCRLDLEDAEGVGRRLYWPEGGPTIARSIPEQDLLIVTPLPIRRGFAAMPDVPDIHRPEKNPYLVDQHGKSQLAPGEKPRESPMRKQRLEKIASSKFRNFLVFHPISQLVVIATGGAARWSSFGSVRMPISSLSSFDGTKMALLIDPYMGDCFFKGGRYDLADRVSLTGEK